MATSRLRQMLQSLPVDDRTHDLSDEALVCRSRGHKWEDQGMTRKRYNDMLREGLMIEAMYCGHGCGCTWTITWSIRDGDIVENKRVYPKDKTYLMPKSSGRLNRSNARVARAARTLAAAA